MNIQSCSYQRPEKESFEAIQDSKSNIIFNSFVIGYFSDEIAQRYECFEAIRDSKNCCNLNLILLTN